MVFIHVVFPGWFGRVIAKLAAFAVPMFFMISGYYAFGNEENVEKTIRRRLKRIIRITVYALAFYFVFFLGRLFCKHELWNGLLSMMTVKTCIKALILGDFDFIGAGHLWFLHSLILAYLVLLFVKRHDLFCMAYKFLPVLFLLRILVCVITNTLGLSWHLRGNILISGLPWMFLGNYFAYKRDSFDKWTENILLWLIGGGSYSYCCLHGF